MTSPWHPQACCRTLSRSSTWSRMRSPYLAVGSSANESIRLAIAHWRRGSMCLVGGRVKVCARAGAVRDGTASKHGSGGGGGGEAREYSGAESARRRWGGRNVGGASSGLRREISLEADDNRSIDRLRRAEDNRSIARSLGTKDKTIDRSLSRSRRRSERSIARSPARAPCWRRSARSAPCSSRPRDR